MKFVTVFKSKAFMITLMFGLFLTSSLIIVAMMMGNQAGNFVIEVESGDAQKSISITDNEDDTVYTNQLVVNGISGMACTTPRNFLGSYNQDDKIAELTEHLGRTVTQETVFVYTFDIVNTGQGPLNMEIEMSYQNNSKSVDEAIRVMTYNPLDMNETVHIYKKPDNPETVIQYYPRTPEMFASATTVYRQDAYLQASEDSEAFARMKYAVFFWIEGYDQHATEELIADGQIKFSLLIKIVN